jgi:NAD(P)-dependent dehydrogenase (short-subunit alcohol dehydrogenase family)
MNLNGQRIVVLGGTSGIGFATAEAAAREGATIVVASRQQESVDRAVSALPSGTEGYTANLGEEDAVRGLFERIGAFDHLVFTAGDGLVIGEFKSLEVAQARKFFDLRFWGALMAARYGSAHIRPGGSIVLTAATSVQRPHKGWAVASAAFGAVESLTRALALELAPIRVNAVAPGLTKTELWGGFPEADREAMYKGTASMLPLGRVGEGADLAGAYLYLMQQGYGTGQIITVDGGGTLV